ncbi:axin-1 isoform X1 [Paramormyrops kingsleyae]|uniref:Axin-1 n=1 Tax=Paramormyrops kingsleyae TaxID=1676925 RepID=A0A3B3QLN8_9TELE|nr:axin-1-like isoform X1 [Paramormyrops kingsleyae]XP_023654361.1 axin-1-like isoform X1 [Paramormyrops kingsleyae]XP_023654362.1 axin-1-like isoform X1 [Paramormyrops kingsleyae]XP_023654363.1 axin-1-like isoform X1 [Paramormyrops kingsleyae]XP_023654365.1 axin-1-like isoform X1 [Paramormyrops kingsleyae]
MSVREKGLPVDLGGSFTEDAPRPPVPGEEGKLVSSDVRLYNHGFYSTSRDGLKNEASTATPRRPDLDLGYEPEGSASPTPPYLKWAESLHSLLDDQDGIHLFMTFLKQEECADLLDFWFACSGFRKLEASEGNEEKKLKLAKAIYKKYILDNNGIVSRQIKPATKSFIKDCVAKMHIDCAMFDQAQTEIQTMMEENTYPLFLKSDIYLEYTRTGGESPKLFSDQSSVSGNGKVLPGYLPTLNEDEEWRCEQDPEVESPCDQTPSNRLTQKLLMETASQRVVPSKRYQERQEYRHTPWREPANPYYVNTGYALAPATSANDSEQQSMSSDADTLSLTDSSVDGIPPYRYRKQHRREMQESAKANGRVPLPHIPRTYRMPKDVHVDPQKFAAELISKLEGVLREREAQEKLEERLRRVRLEEEGEDADVSTAPSLSSQRLPPASHPQHYAGTRYADLGYNGLQLRDAHEENPESILDEHVQRVMKTPGCQSPGTGRHSPQGYGKYTAKPVSKAELAGPYHQKHAHHHHGAGGKPAKEQLEAEAALRVQAGFAWGLEAHHYASRARGHGDNMAINVVEALACSSKGGTLSKRTLKKALPEKVDEVRAFDLLMPSEDLERNRQIIQWMMEGEKEACRKKNLHGNPGGSKKPPGHEATRLSSVERPGPVHSRISAQLRNTVQPSHPFIQDPTMPPNPAPNPLTQLEEARRRLEEEKRRSGTLQTKQRYVLEVMERGRTAARPALIPAFSVVPAVSDIDLSEPEHKATKRTPCENITVAYYFCGEPIPYRTSVKGRIVTLGQFKELLTKKGSYRYYFKKVSHEFDCGVVFEEVREDDAILPIYEEKIVGKVEKID